MKEKENNPLKNNRHDKNSDSQKFLELIKDFPLGKILSLVSIYGFAVFIIPYFLYHRFLPVDMSFDTIPVKFLILITIAVVGFASIITLVAVGFFLFFFTFLYIYPDIKANKEKGQFVFIIGALHIVAILLGLLISFKESEYFYVIFLILLIVGLADFFYSKKRIDLPFFKLITISIFRTISSFFILISSMSLFFIWFVLGNFDFISTLIVVIITIILILLSGLSIYTGEYVPSILLATLPIIYLFFNWNGFIKFLETSYSFLGVTSNKNIVCIKEDFPLNIMLNSNILEYSCNGICSILYEDTDLRIKVPIKFSLQNKENLSKSFKCFKNLKIIWNGNDSIWIKNKLKNEYKENDKNKDSNKVNKNKVPESISLTISIPKRHLLNNDIINFRYSIKEETQTQENSNSHKK
ncbi:MAG: hypothetical protein GXO22_05595 [Aquificae bacterium]|nr:hypothetical protein [Aquificota bacterium]